jgi:hypothetical protein
MQPYHACSRCKCVDIDFIEISSTADDTTDASKARKRTYNYRVRLIRSGVGVDADERFGGRLSWSKATRAWTCVAVAVLAKR